MQVSHRLAAPVIAAGIAITSTLSGIPPVALSQEFAIPKPLAAGHEELYARMEAATQAGGDVGEAATAVMEALAPHFQKEEEYALPQLGLLPSLAGPPLAAEARELTPKQREEVIVRTERLRAELPQMLEEHEAIAAALENLREAAEAAGETEIVRLAEEIGVHARTEEKVLYPAALLIGDHVRQQGGPVHP